MKKVFAILVALMLMISMTAALAEAPVMGGWTPSADPAVTEEVKAVFDKGMEKLLGVSYVPVAFLGTQVVAGTNYCFLAQATVIYPDAQPTYVMVYLYQDLQGNVSVLHIANLDIGALCQY